MAQLRSSPGNEQCPCGSGSGFEVCCKPILDGARAETAEALMRSRYVAYVLRNEAYLLRSWHPRTRPATVETSPDQRWLGLKIKRTEQGDADDSEGIVEFVARFKIGGRGHRLHEVSRFEKTDDGWKYVDGEVEAT